MKRSVRVLSFIVSMIAVFGLTSVGFAQTKSVKAKKVQEVKPAVTQPAVEESVVTTPDTDVKTTSVTKKDSVVSLGLDFGFDFLAKYKKLEEEAIDETEDDLDQDETIGSSNKSAHYMNLKLSVNFNTDMFRFGFGIGFILPNKHSGTGELVVLKGTGTVDPQSAAEVKQKLNFGIALQLIQFGYRIKLGSMELIPYAGLDLLYLKATNSYDWFYANGTARNETGSTELHKISIPIYTGLDFVFVNVGPVSFYTGLEFGYAVEVMYKDDTKGWGYRGGDVSDEIMDESDPLTGITAKAKIGTALNF